MTTSHRHTAARQNAYSGGVREAGGAAGRAAAGGTVGALATGGSVQGAITGSAETLMTLAFETAKTPGAVLPPAFWVAWEFKLTTGKPQNSSTCTTSASRCRPR